MRQGPTGRHPGQPPAQGRAPRAEPRHRQARAARAAADRARRTGRGSRWPRCRRARRCSRPWWPRSTATTTTRQLDARPRRSCGIFERTPGVVDVDWYVEDPQPRVPLRRRPGEGGAHGVPTDQMVETLRVAARRDRARASPTCPAEKEDVPISSACRASSGPASTRSARSSSGARAACWCRSRRAGPRRGDRGSAVHLPQEPEAGGLRHGDVAGDEESPVYAILQMNATLDQLRCRTAYRVAPVRREPAVPHRPRLDEVGRRVAHHLRGVPRPGPGLRARCWS